MNHGTVEKNQGFQTLQSFFPPNLKVFIIFIHTYIP